jgi:hypothetical protein
MAFFWRELSGREGKIIIPSLGAVIGTMGDWKLYRPEESTQGNPGVLTLRAFLSYVNPVLMEQPLEKHVIIKITKDKQYRVSYQRMALDGQNLLLEECELCRVES